MREAKKELHYSTLKSTMKIHSHLSLEISDAETLSQQI